MAGCFSAETFRQQERTRSFTVFHHNGIRICQKTFLFLHAMGYSRFKAIKASFVANGVVARVNGNKGKSRRKDKLTLKQIQDVVQFIMNYAGVCTSLSRCLCVSARERERRKSMFKKYTLSTCTCTLYTTVHYFYTQSCVCHSSMSKLTRLQRHVATWESAWLQGLWCEAPGIHHYQARPLGALSPGSSDHLDESSGIPNLHSALAAASPQCSGDEADE